ncbi:MAG: restriction endonuclease subunit S, partial [Eggerthellaceae bacterium]|nr:restriction endonuclease subunit S [Eggerthellaceae bacterium]
MQRYEAYKDSGVEWIGEIPAGWEVVNLSALATQRKRKNIGSIEGNVLSLSYGRIKRRIIDNSGLLPESFETYNVIEPGDIVLRLTDLQNDQVSLRVGRSCERGIITSAYCTLNPNNVDSRYLFDILACFDYQKGFYGLAGGVRQGLTFDGIKGLKFPLPLIREQRAIADYLDEKTAEIDSIVSQTERSIELLREYRKSVISEAVTKGLDPDVPMRDSGVEWIGEIPEGWERDKVSRLFDSIGSGTTPKSDNLGYYDGDIPWIQSGDLGSGPLRSTQKTITRFAIESLSSLSVFKAPFLVIAMYGASIGSMALSTIDACTNQACCVLAECKGSLSFFEYVLSAAKQHLIDQGIGGTQPNISQQLIKALWLPVPPLPEQQAIVDYLDTKTAEIDSLIADKQRQVELLKEYRKSLISEAVTGK